LNLNNLINFIMSESFLSHGRRISDSLELCKQNPDSITGPLARERDLIVDGAEIPRDIFNQFVSRIAEKVQGKVDRYACLDESGTYSVKMAIRYLAEQKARETVEGRLQDITARDLEPIIKHIEMTVTTARVQCQNCLARPKECQWRHADAPFDEVYKKTRDYGKFNGIPRQPRDL
jgi:hypothetical protein